MSRQPSREPASTHNQRSGSVVLGVDGIVVRRTRPDLSRGQVDASPAVDGIAIEDRCQFLEIDGERAEVTRAALECVGELGVAVETAAPKTLDALAGERAPRNVEKRVADELHNGVELAPRAQLADGPAIALGDGDAQVAQRVSIPLHRRVPLRGEAFVVAPNEALDGVTVGQVDSGLQRGRREHFRRAPCLRVIDAVEQRLAVLLDGCDRLAQPLRPAPRAGVRHSAPSRPAPRGRARRTRAPP